MSIKTRAQLTNENNLVINDNTNQDITPADLRGLTQNIIDSTFNVNDSLSLSSFQANSISGNSFFISTVNFTDYFHNGDVALYELAYGTGTAGVQTSPKLYVSNASGGGLINQVNVVSMPDPESYAGYHIWQDTGELCSFVGFTVATPTYYQGTSLGKSSTSYINSPGGLVLSGGSTVILPADLVGGGGGAVRIDNVGIRFTTDRASIHSANSYAFEAGKLKVDANKIYSGTTDMSNLFGNTALDYNAKLATKANLSGATFTGIISSPLIQSGGTNISTILAGYTRTAGVPGGIGPANSVFSEDNRDEVYAPSGRSAGFYVDFRANIADGLADGAGSFHGVLHYKPYGIATDHSGGLPHQLGFTQAGNMWMRTGLNTAAWDNWKRFVFFDEVNTKASLSGATFTGAIIGTSATFSGTLVGGTLQSPSMTSSGSTRLVQASSAGTLSASVQVINAYGIDGAITAMLESAGNWTANGSYTGTSITGTYQGQKHYDDNYFYEAVGDNVFIRLIRG